MSSSKNQVIDKDFGFEDIVSEIQKMNGSYVKIGFLQGEKTKAQTKGKRKKEAGQSLVQIAAQNEFGTDKIPARPFMRTSYDENKDKINRIIASEYNKIVEGQSTVFRSLSALGLYVENLIRVKIRSIQYPPNSPVTIALKGSSKPLIDFGQMIAGVHHQVVIK